MSETTIAPPVAASASGQPPINPDFDSESTETVADRITLDEGPILLQRPKKELSADSVRDLEDWFDVVIRRMKRKAGIETD